jgi:hypothetical protein
MESGSCRGSLPRDRICPARISRLYSALATRASGSAPHAVWLAGKTANCETYTDLGASRRHRRNYRGRLRDNMGDSLWALCNASLTSPIAFHALKRTVLRKQKSLHPAEPRAFRFSTSGKSPTHSPNRADTRLSRFLGAGRITGKPHLTRRRPFGRVTEGLPTIRNRRPHQPGRICFGALLNFRWQSSAAANDGKYAQAVYRLDLWEVPAQLPGGSRMKTKQLGGRGEAHFQPNGAKQAYWLRKSCRDLQRQ